MVLGVGVPMKLLDVLEFIAVGILPHVALCSLTDDFHRSAVGPHKGNDRIGDEPCRVSDLLCRLTVRQTVDLQQHTSVVDIGPLIGSLCHQHRREAHQRSLREFVDQFAALEFSCTDHLHHVAHLVASIALFSIALVD